MTTLENNKLIAEFMGIALAGGGVSFFESNPNWQERFRLTNYETDGLCPHCHNNANHGHNKACYTIDGSKLKYDTSWDWLMPVVEKIDDILMDDQFVEISYNRCYIDNLNVNMGFDVIGNSRIEATWGCAIKFIQWHNTQ